MPCQRLTQHMSGIFCIYSVYLTCLNSFSSFMLRCIKCIYCCCYVPVIMCITMLCFALQIMLIDDFRGGERKSEKIDKEEEKKEWVIEKSYQTRMQYITVFYQSSKSRNLSGDTWTNFERNIIQRRQREDSAGRSLVCCVEVLSVASAFSL